MRKFNHTSIVESVVTIVYITGFLSLLTFTITTAISQM